MDSWTLCSPVPIMTHTLRPLALRNRDVSFAEIWSGLPPSTCLSESIEHETGPTDMSADPDMQDMPTEPAIASKVRTNCFESSAIVTSLSVVDSLFALLNGVASMEAMHFAELRNQTQDSCDSGSSQSIEVMSAPF